MFILRTGSFLALLHVLCFVPTGLQAQHDRDILPAVIWPQEHWQYPFLSGCDTGAIMKKLDRGHEIINDLPDSAFSILREALQESRQCDFAKGTVQALTGIGTVYHHAGKADSALLFGEEALAQSRRAGYSNGIIRSLKALGNAYTDYGLYEQSIQIFLDLAKYADTSAEGMKLASNAYLGLLKSYGIMGKYDKVVSYIARLMAIAKAHPEHTEEVCKLYQNMAMLMYSMPESFKQASGQNEHYYWKLAEKYARKGGSITTLVNVLIYKGCRAIEDNDTVQGFNMMQTALKLCDSVSNRGLKRVVLTNLGSIYIALDQPQKALSYFLEARALNNEVIFPNSRVNVNARLGETYCLLHRYTEAEATLKEAYTEAKALRLYQNLSDINEQLSKLYEAIGKPALAFQHYREYVSYRDSTATAETARSLNILDIKYRTLQKDKELTEKQLLIAKQKQQLNARNVWIIAISTGLVTLAILLITLVRSYRNRRRRVSQQQEIAQLKAMMQGEENERNRIARELHDGVASELMAMKIGLQAIEQEYTMLQNSGSFHSILEQSGEITLKLRQTAHNLMPVNLKELGLYASVEAFIHKINNRNIHFSFQPYNTLPAIKLEVEKIIFLMVMELIQNIIKHSKATEAIVQLDYFGEMLTITIEDNGVGMTENAGKTTEGMGLANVRKNVEALHAMLDIKSSEYTGTTICVEIPLEAHIVGRMKEMKE